MDQVVPQWVGMGECGSGSTTVGGDGECGPGDATVGGGKGEHGISVGYFF